MFELKQLGMGMGMGMGYTINNVLSGSGWVQECMSLCVVPHNVVVIGGQPHLCTPSYLVAKGAPVP